MTSGLKRVRDCVFIGQGCPRAKDEEGYCSADTAPKPTEFKRDNCRKWLCEELEKMIEYLIINEREIKRNCKLETISIAQGGQIEAVVIHEVPGGTKWDSEEHREKHPVAIDEEGNTYLQLADNPDVYHPNRKISELKMHKIKKIFEILRGEK